MAQLTSKAQDGATSKQSVIAVAGQTVVSQDWIILADIFEGSTLDESARWSKTTASGGTVAQASATGCTLAPSTNTNGSAILQSQAVIPFTAGTEVSMKMSARAGTVGVAQNTREMGLRVDGSNYIQFLMNGADFVARVQSGGSTWQTDVQVNTVRADDMLPMDLEIRVSRCPDEIYWLATIEGGTVVLASAKQRASATRLFQGALSQAYFRTLNAGSAVDNTLILNSVLVSQRWNGPGAVIQSKKMTGDGIVCRGPALYYGMRRTASTGGAAVMYDNVSAAGTIVDEYGSGMTEGGPWASPRFCYNGLYVDLTTDAVNVFYVAL